MTSSMLSGDRRWTSGRKGGMTVLGKVAVPKPINLPSQRLENHGRDPSVEIVPKGTLGWGNKSSSSSTNPWGSSTLSSNTDGGSPSHLNGRPSSGGGTRPSTANSDRSHEPNAWGSNSRPSSASGALAINQTPATILRPRSAETRPGSAHLSRFADKESPSARSAAGINEISVGESSKKDGFSLTSGDFPTLGLEKENSGTEGRPGSSGGVAPARQGGGTNMPGDVSVNDSVKVGASNSFGRDHPPNMEKWQPDFQSYPNPNIPPQQHYDAWGGPPMNNHPPGVWYRGPPGGPPYNSPVPPGGFPMEPFPYYRPQIPPPALANPHLVPQPGAGPGPIGPHPKNGDMYRPHMPDAYMRPGMPIRPGFYHGPPIPPCEGYYGPPPVGYCNSNERDIIFMGMPAGPPPYNRYAGPNAPDGGSSHPRPSGHFPSSKPLHPEQVQSGNNPHDTRGPFKDLLKHHPDDLDEKDEGKNWEDSVTSNIDKGNQPLAASRDNDWRANHRKDEEMELRRRAHGEEASKKAFDRRGGGSSVPRHSIENTGNLKPSDEVLVKKHELGVPVAPQDSSLIQKIESLNAKARTADGAPQDSSLIQKIESLNVKARAADGRPDVLYISDREEQRNKFANVYHEPTHGSEIADPSGPLISRTHTHGVQGRFDHRGKNERGNGPALYDPSDTPAQRNKMAELAKQRALQRQKEEEERSRDQKARALAKLEELNRRTQSGEVVNQKPETQSGEVVNQKPESVPISQNKQLEPTPAASKLGASSSVSGSKSNNSSISVVEKPTVPLSENLTSIDKKPSSAQNLSVPVQQEVDGAETVMHNNAPQVHDYKQKRAIYKQKQGNFDKPTMAEVVKSRTDIAASSQATSKVGGNSESSLPENTSVVHESSLQQRKKNNRGSKYRNRVDEASSTSVLPTEEIRTRISESISVPSFVKTTPGPDDVNQSSSANEEGIDRVNNHLKPQHHLRTSRNPQSNRAADKFHGGGGEAVVWAPVRAHNKNEVIEEAGSKTIDESTDQGQNNVRRNKRAEMELYVPKPGAKEIAQQGSSLPSVDETVERASLEFKGSDSYEQGGSSVGKTGGAILNSGNVGDRQNNKHGKGSAWRQRGSESIIMPPSQTTRNVEHSRPQKPEANTVKDKMHAFKGHKGTGGSQDFDLKKTSSEESNKISTHDPVLSSVPVSRSTSHWQPKSRASSGTTQKETSQKEVSGPHHASISKKSFAEATSSHLGVPESKREQKMTYSTNKRISHPTSQGPHGLVEQPQMDSDAQQERRPLSGYRRNGNQNNRYGRGQDHYGDRNSSGQAYNDNTQRDNRPRNNPHYEYQPVGSQKPSNFEGPKDGASRYNRDRNQGHSRRGGGRQSGNVRADFSNSEREAQRNDDIEWS